MKIAYNSHTNVLEQFCVSFHIFFFFSKFALAVKGFDRKEVIPCHSPPIIASHIF